MSRTESEVHMLWNMDQAVLDLWFLIYNFNLLEDLLEEVLVEMKWDAVDAVNAVVV